MMLSRLRTRILPAVALLALAACGDGTTGPTSPAAATPTFVVSHVSGYMPSSGRA